jgi:hypothetical protein
VSDYTLTSEADFGLLYDIARLDYDADEWRRRMFGLSRDEFAALCRAHKLPSIGYAYRGRPIGGMVFEGTSAHMAVLPEFHGKWGTLWKPTLAWLFALKDPIRVAIDRGNAKCLRFMDRNNWPRVGADERSVTFEMSSGAWPRGMAQGGAR